MVDIAPHIRIFDPTPSDETFEKVTSAVKLIDGHFRKVKNVHALVTLAESIAESILPEANLSSELSDKVVEFIKKSQPVFEKEDNPLQVSTCVALGALSLLHSQKPTTGTFIWAITDVINLCLVSALSYQTPRIEPRTEALRQQLLSEASDRFTKIGISLRQRHTVPNIEIPALDISAPEKWSQAIKDSLEKSILPLRTNAVLDREELNFLWWYMGDWTDSLSGRISALSTASAALARAFDGVKLLRRLPAEAHKNLITRSIDPGLTFSLAELIETLGQDGPKLLNGFKNLDMVKVNPNVFPLCSALLGIKTNIDTGKLSLIQWTERAILEGSILQMSSITDADI